MLLLARTGLRLGDALALKVEDIDLPARHLWVRRTWGSRVKANGPLRFNTPKGCRERCVDLSKHLTATLRNLYATGMKRPGILQPQKES